jgi:hypothetical protein
VATEWRRRPMKKWSVRIVGEPIVHLGTVKACDKRDAVVTAVRVFGVPYVLQGRIVVSRQAGLSGWFGQLQDWYRSRQK